MRKSYKKHRMGRLGLLAMAAMLMVSLSSGACKADPKVVGKDLEYQQDGKPYLGYVAVDENKEGKRPGILLIHEWTGLGDYVKSRADQLAAMGYTVFAMDMYGKGIRAQNHDEAAKLMTQYNEDRPLMRSRMEKALEILKSQATVDGDRIAVIGYCFGGGAAIEFALTGADVDAVVSFHGVLGSPNLEKDAGKIKAAMQIHQGADDGFVPKETIETLKKTLDEANVNYTFFSYPGAVHGFTRPTAGSDKSTGIAYDPEADKLSWKRMTEFLEKTLE
ncbi:MAG: dienelactone hydrolase family protein [Leptospiraceae bacterium]|nr:dienelactone hydrolase family protein [Leptospiraceae bacterium]MCB1304927.1 dienelactone hydrolase family protein [Leptospiraceae bacterium]